MNGPRAGEVYSSMIVDRPPVTDLLVRTTTSFDYRMAPLIVLTGPWARKVLEMIEKGTVPESKVTEMQYLRVGPLACITIPGEPAQEIGHAIEKRFRGELDVEDVWPVGYANDVVGYLCTERHHEEGGYEPNAYPYYGEPARFKDEERVILETAEALVRG